METAVVRFRHDLRVTDNPPFADAVGDADYVTTWLPEQDGLPARYAHRPWRMDARERTSYGVDYPRPMLDIEARYDELGG